MSRPVGCAHSRRTSASIAYRYQLGEQTPDAWRPAYLGEQPGRCSVPDESGPLDSGFRISFIYRAPFLWRLRALRCRFLEWREEVVG